MNNSSQLERISPSQEDQHVSELKAGEEIVLPVLQEELNIQKKQIVTGVVRLRKLVQEREELVNEPLLSETVEVERIPVNRVVEGPIAPRYEGQTTIISVIEEVLVVSKQLVLKEEIRITKRITEAPYLQQVILRSEQIEVDHLQSSE